ncbi:MAG: hypothetical protein OHK006_09210 [Thermodesulfovibrionales bacterium]
MTEVPVLLQIPRLPEEPAKLLLFRTRPLLLQHDSEGLLKTGDYSGLKRVAVESRHDLLERCKSAGDACAISAEDLQKQPAVDAIRDRSLLQQAVRPAFLC